LQGLAGYPWSKPEGALNEATAISPHLPTTAEPAATAEELGGDLVAGSSLEAALDPGSGLGW